MRVCVCSLPATAAQLAGLRLLPLLDGTTAGLAAAGRATHTFTTAAATAAAAAGARGGGGGGGMGGTELLQVWQQQLQAPAPCFFVPTADEARLLARTGACARRRGPAGSCSTRDCVPYMHTVHNNRFQSSTEPHAASDISMH